MFNIELSYYKNILSSMRRGLIKGRFSNAKPLYFLAIVEAISRGGLLENKFFYDDTLETLYLEMCNLYEPGLSAAPFYKTYYRSSSEEYYKIIWKDGVNPPEQSKSPSRRYLKENVQYAYLDDKLWDLLMVPSNRAFLRESLTNKFINSKD